jgi:hypothetical protein
VHRFGQSITCKMCPVIGRPGELHSLYSATSGVQVDALLFSATSGVQVDALLFSATSGVQVDALLFTATSGVQVDTPLLLQRLSEAGRGRLDNLDHCCGRMGVCKGGARGRHRSTDRRR